MPARPRYARSAPGAAGHGDRRAAVGIAAAAGEAAGSRCRALDLAVVAGGGAVAARITTQGRIAALCRTALGAGHAVAAIPGVAGNAALAAFAGDALGRGFVRRLGCSGNGHGAGLVAVAEFRRAGYQAGGACQRTGDAAADAVGAAGDATGLASLRGACRRHHGKVAGAVAALTRIHRVASDGCRRLRALGAAAAVGLCHGRTAAGGRGLALALVGRAARRLAGAALVAGQRVVGPRLGAGEVGVAAEAGAVDRFRRGARRAELGILVGADVGGAGHRLAGAVLVAGHLRRTPDLGTGHVEALESARHADFGRRLVGRGTAEGLEFFGIDVVGTRHARAGARLIAGKFR